MIDTGVYTHGLRAIAQLGRGMSETLQFCDVCDVDGMRRTRLHNGACYLHGTRPSRGEGRVEAQLHEAEALARLEQEMREWAHNNRDARAKEWAEALRALRKKLGA